MKNAAANGMGTHNEAFEAHEDDYEYQAASPDEKALLEACQRLHHI